jgi:homoserine trans-succinylase
MVPSPGVVLIGCLGDSLMVRTMLAAAAALVLVVGVKAADEKKADPNQITGTFVKYNADKNEITVKVKSDEMTYPLSKDAKVAVGTVKDAKDLSKLKAGDSVTLTLKKDGDKTWATEVNATKPNGSGKN